VTTGKQPKRGDVILFPLTVLSGPGARGWYDVGFQNEQGLKRLTTTLPNDTQIIDHVSVPDELSDGLSQGIKEAETYRKAKRGDVILFPLTILDGPNEKDQYDLKFFDEWLRYGVRLTSTLPNDSQIINHVEVSLDINGE
jgi:hypothetical protein